MAIFGVIVEDNKKLNQFIKVMHKKLLSPDMFENPFKGFIKKISKQDETFLFVHFDLIWINPFYPALYLTVGLLIAFAFRLHWSLLFTLPLWMGTFMFTTIFSKLALKFSLRKFGYKGKIKFMHDSDLLLRLANWENKK
jgi:hypothetical protein